MSYFQDLFVNEKPWNNNNNNNPEAEAQTS